MGRMPDVSQHIRSIRKKVGEETLIDKRDLRNINQMGCVAFVLILIQTNQHSSHSKESGKFRAILSIEAIEVLSVDFVTCDNGVAMLKKVLTVKRYIQKYLRVKYNA